MSIAINHCGMWAELERLGLDLNHDTLMERVIARTKERLTQIGKGLWPKHADETPAGVELFATHCTEEVLRTNTAKAREGLNTDARVQQVVGSANRYADSVKPDYATVDAMEISLGLTGEVTKLLLGNDERSEEVQPAAFWVMAWGLAPRTIRIGSEKLANDIRLDLSALLSTARSALPLNEVGDQIGTVGEAAFNRAMLIRAREMTKAMLENQKLEPGEDEIPSAVNLIAFAALQQRIASIATHLVELTTDYHFDVMVSSAARQHVSAC